MFDQTQIKQLIQADELAWYACPHQTCLTRGCSNEQNIAHQTRVKFQVKFLPKAPGTYNITVKINGDKLGKSPLVV